MGEKVRISKIEIGGDGAACRVILSDGKELDGLQRVAPSEVTTDNLLTVQIDAVIGPFDDGVNREDMGKIPAPRLSPKGDRLICDVCGRSWVAGNPPNCPDCALAWSEIEVKG